MDLKKEEVRRLALAGLFLALTLVLGMTPLGIIPLVVINVTILHIPVIVGTVAMGLKFGMVLGACFGVASALSAFGLSLASQSVLAAALVAANPLLAIVMCIVPRLIVPVVTHFAYRLVAGKNEKSPKALPVAAIAGSLTNTVLYLGMMCLFYWAVGLDLTAVLTIIGGTGLIAGGSEAAIAAILVTPITAALWKIR